MLPSLLFCRVSPSFCPLNHQSLIFRKSTIRRLGSFDDVEVPILDHHRLSNQKERCNTPSSPSPSPSRITYLFQVVSLPNVVSFTINTRGALPSPTTFEKFPDLTSLSLGPSVKNSQLGILSRVPQLTSLSLQGPISAKGYSFSFLLSLDPSSRSNNLLLFFFSIFISSFQHLSKYLHDPKPHHSRHRQVFW